MNTYPTLCNVLLLGMLTLAGCDRHGAAAHSSPAGLDWQAPITVATGPAHIGPWRMNDSEFHYVDDAAVALHDDGTVAVVWVDNEHQRVLFQRYGADNQPQLANPVDVSRSPAIFSWLPRVLFTDDQIYVLWEEIVFSGGSHGGEIFFARSDDRGQSFSEPQNLSNTSAGAGKGNSAWSPSP